MNWDDNLNFLENVNYRGLSPEHLRWMFTTFHLGPYQPLSWLTLGLDYQFHGMDARGYHLTSLLLHAINAGLFVALAFALYRASRGAPGTRPRAPFTEDGRRLPAAALLAGLVFAVHPQRVESVAWVTERRDVVSGLFLLLAVILHLGSIEAAGDVRRKRLAAGAALAFVLSLLAKATGVTAPLALLIFDLHPLRRFAGGLPRLFAPENRHLWLEKLPWFAASLVFGIVAVIGQREAGALKDVAAFGIADRAGLTLYAAGFYLWKLLLPIGLSPLYELRADFSPFAWPHVLLAIGFLGAAATLIFARRAWPAGLAAMAAFFVLIAPLSGAARAGHQVAADRYTYLATMPWALVAGALVLLVPAARWKGATAVGGALVLGLATLTLAQSKIWRDSIALWTQASRVDPKSDKAAMNLASAYVEKKQLTEARDIYEARLTRNPSLGDARYSLGMVYFMAGQSDVAEQHFRQLIEEQPAFAMGHYGLGVLRMDQGEFEEARREMETALSLEPRLTLARQALERLVSPPMR